MSIKKYNRNTLGGILIHLVLAFSIIVFVTLFYFYVYLPKSTNHGETITVPNIEGLPITKVAEFLVKHDLRYEVNDSSYSSQYPPLTVLKQYPRAGAQVKENRKIYVSINRVNPPTVPMPDLIDGSLINADAVLRGNELKRGKIHFVSGPFLNLVKEMKTGGNTIAPGARIPKGTVIDLVVMDGGTDIFPTPNLDQLSYEDAKFVLLGTNLSVGNVVLQGDTTGAHAVVIKQKPDANENIKVGETVDLWIGKPGDEINDQAPIDDQDTDEDTDTDN
jgi:beta-lactam-binding protein with PASTA domain